MLLHYKHHSTYYKFLMKHLNESTKTFVFITTRNEDIPKKTLEEVLTLYLLKTDLVDYYNLTIIIYRNKFYLSKFIDINKFKQIHFDFKHRVIIKDESKVDENIKQLFKSKIDLYFSINVYFDKYDYDLLTREKKREHRLNSFKKNRRKEKLKSLFNLKFLKIKNIA